MQGTSALDGEVITGDYVGAVVGVRIATPFFGTGFNFCIGEVTIFLALVAWGSLQSCSPRLSVFRARACQHIPTVCDESSCLA